MSVPGTLFLLALCLPSSTVLSRVRLVLYGTVPYRTRPPIHSALSFSSGSAIASPGRPCQRAGGIGRHGTSCATNGERRETRGERSRSGTRHTPHATWPDGPGAVAVVCLPLHHRRERALWPPFGYGIRMSLEYVLLLCRSRLFSRMQRLMTRVLQGSGTGSGKDDDAPRHLMPEPGARHDVRRPVRATATGRWRYEQAHVEPAVGPTHVGVRPSPRVGRRGAAIVGPVQIRSVGPSTARASSNQLATWVRIVDVTASE